MSCEPFVGAIDSNPARRADEKIEHHVDPDGETFAVGFVVAWHRDESESCGRLTPGCCVDHVKSNHDTCETW